ncbi:MAG: type III ribulose-bisphosphate carboxylase [Candidatus Aenigmatarchaeota archaeon]
MFMEFVKPDYTPKESDLVCLFRLKPSEDLSFREAISNVAKESSVGTWTHIDTVNERAKRIKAHVFEIDGPYAKVAYPKELFELGNVPQILSSIAGNIFGMKLLESLRLEDTKFPTELLEKHRGPQVGLEGIRELFGVEGRPLLGTIVKPKLGLDSREHAQVAYRAWKGGLDVVKDDENLSSMGFNAFRRRVDETMKLKKKAEKETGERKEYMGNITAPVSEMKKRADLLMEKGSNYVMIDIITTGWSALQDMREYLEGEDVVIHCHRAGHAAFTRNKRHGISMLVVAKFTRLIGGDQLHIGTAGVGKMEGGEDKVLRIEEAVESQNYGDGRRKLGQDWENKNKTVAVASGGLHPGDIPELVDRMGKDIVAQFGGGCHGHPDGTEAGAKAIRQACEATMENVELEEAAEENEELRRALEKWER